MINQPRKILARLSLSSLPNPIHAPTYATPHRLSESPPLTHGPPLPSCVEKDLYNSVSEMDRTAARIDPAAL